MALVNFHNKNHSPGFEAFRYSSACPIVAGLVRITIRFVSQGTSSAVSLEPEDSARHFWLFLEALKVFHNVCL